MSDITALVIALAALSIALLAYSGSRKKEDTVSSINWDSVMKWAAIPTMIVIVAIGYFIIIPKFNEVAISSGYTSLIIDPSTIIILPVGLIIAMGIGAVAMLLSFREPGQKNATNHKEKMEAKTE